MGLAIVCMVKPISTSGVGNANSTGDQCGTTFDTNSSLDDMLEVRLHQCSHVHMYFTSCLTSVPH